SPVFSYRPPTPHPRDPPPFPTRRSSDLPVRRPVQRQVAYRHLAGEQRSPRSDRDGVGPRVGGEHVQWLGAGDAQTTALPDGEQVDRKSTRLNSSHLVISYAVFCLKKKNN